MKCLEGRPPLSVLTPLSEDPWYEDCIICKDTESKEHRLGGLNHRSVLSHSPEAGGPLWVGLAPLSARAGTAHCRSPSFRDFADSLWCSL